MAKSTRSESGSVERSDTTMPRTPARSAPPASSIPTPPPTGPHNLGLGSAEDLRSIINEGGQSGSPAGKRKTSTSFPGKEKSQVNLRVTANEQASLSGQETSTSPKKARQQVPVAAQSTQAGETSGPSVSADQEVLDLLRRSITEARSNKNGVDQARYFLLGEFLVPRKLAKGRDARINSARALYDKVDQQYWKLTELHKETDHRISDLKAAAEKYLPDYQMDSSADEAEESEA